MRRFVTEIFLFQLIISTAFWGNPAVAGNGDEIRVEQIKPGAQNDTLTLSANLENLFSEKITGTIESGLPSIITVEIMLLQSDKTEVISGMITRTINYDIWKEVYSVEQQDTTLTFTTFDEMKQFSRRIESLPILKIQTLNSGKSYFFQMRTSIVPITTRQADKISDWLLDPNQTEESVASSERASGFSMNLNKLVSFFVGGKKRSRYSSEWYTSDRFRVSDLLP